MTTHLPAGLEWLAPFLPSWTLLAVGVPAAAAYACAAAALAGWLRSRRGVRAPYTRKVFHFFIISAAAAVQVLWGLPGTVIFGAVTAIVVLVAVLVGSGFAFYEALARPTDAPHRSLFVLVPLATTAAGGVLVNILFGHFAPVGYMVTGWGDAVGEPVGTRWGKHRYQVPSLAGVPATRSLEGSGAVLLMGAGAAAVVLSALGYPATSAIRVGALCGLAGAVIEAFSSHGLDNLTVQVGAAFVAWVLLR